MQDLLCYHLLALLSVTFVVWECAAPARAKGRPGGKGKKKGVKSKAVKGGRHGSAGGAHAAAAAAVPPVQKKRVQPREGDEEVDFFVEPTSPVPEDHILAPGAPAQGGRKERLHPLPAFKAEWWRGMPWKHKNALENCPGRIRYDTLQLTGSCRETVHILRMGH